MVKTRDRVSVFQLKFREDLRFWVQPTQRIAIKILDLIKVIIRRPFTGIGKHEPLKHLAPGAWSHRITEEHRLVYLVTDDRVDFLQGRYHYTR